MTIPTNRNSYRDIFEVWERALSAPKGIRLPFDHKGDAEHYRMRLNNARTIDRKENAKVYDEGDPLYNASVYDVLVVRIVRVDPDPGSPTGKTFFVYIEPRDKLTPTIEVIEDEEDAQAN